MTERPKDWLDELEEREEEQLRREVPAATLTGAAPRRPAVVLMRVTWRCLRWFHRRLRLLEEAAGLDAGEP
jgi:hypothetical protein